MLAQSAMACRTSRTKSIGVTFLSEGAARIRTPLVRGPDSNTKMVSPPEASDTNLQVNSTFYRSARDGLS